MDKACASQIREFEANQSWFMENFKSILKEHKDKFVAVWHQRVLDADSDLATLRDRVNQKTKGAKGIYVEYVTDKPIELVLYENQRIF